MSAPKLSDGLAQQAIDAVAQFKTMKAAGAALDVPPETVLKRRDAGVARGFKPSGARITHYGDEPAQLKRQITRLEHELKQATKKTLDEAAIRSEILKLNHDVIELDAPAWATRPARAASSPGVPTLFLSDLHWGEVVKPGQINNVNQYNVAIAHRRMDNVVGTADHLLDIISPKRDFPGIHLILGGDMISGNIHDELQTTNELNTMPTVLDLYGKLVGVISHLRAVYGRVFITCVTGNHGRDTHKIWHKDRHATSFDWLLYCFLAKHFEADKNITFFIPDGPDAYFKIFNHRYLLTHGDQFRGGDGVIGPLGPIIRGDHRKRSRNGQIDMAYDTLLMGHWHSYMHLTRLIVNGSLKGYDEFAYDLNFGFERPQQGLWVTHPDRGITFSMPVLADRGLTTAAKKTAWASISS